MTKSSVRAHDAVPRSGRELRLGMPHENSLKRGTSFVRGLLEELDLLLFDHKATDRYRFWRYGCGQLTTALTAPPAVEAVTVV